MASGGTEKPGGGARPGREAAPPAPSAKPAPSTKPAGASKETSGAERRRHPRVAARVPFRIVNEAGRDEPFRLVDLSECGARIQVRTAIPPMTRIQVALVLPAARLGLEEDVRVDTAGVVVWCHPTEDTYDTGVFFPDLVEEQRRLLRDLVRSSS
jgi:hypothetical protein